MTFLVMDGRKQTHIELASPLKQEVRLARRTWMPLQRKTRMEKEIPQSNPKEVTYQNKNNDHLNAIQSDLSKDKMVKIKKIEDKRMKEKFKTSSGGFLINSEAPIRNIKCVIAQAR